MSAREGETSRCERGGTCLVHLRGELCHSLRVLLLDVGGVRLHLLARLGAGVRPRVHRVRRPGGVVGQEGTASGASGRLLLGGVHLRVQLQRARDVCVRSQPHRAGSTGSENLRTAPRRGRNNPPGLAPVVGRTGRRAKKGSRRWRPPRRHFNTPPKRAVGFTAPSRFTLAAHLLDLLVQVVALVLGVGLGRAGTKAL